MSIPAPTPLGSQPTVSLACLAGVFPRDLLREVTEGGFAPVLHHRLPGESGSSEDGPREMLAATMRALKHTGHGGRWGAGCVVGTTEDAALFATAGYTWFAFELSNLLDSRADRMSLDELDAAIVAIEDGGCYPHGWHDAYLGREWRSGAGSVLRFDDETLARCGVKFGRAIAQAEQMQQTIRTLWSGHGECPDVELCFPARRVAMSAAEFLFVATESARRGLNPVSIAPSFGPAWQPGADFVVGAGALENAIAPLCGVGTLSGMPKIGVYFAGGKPGILAEASLPGPHLHLNCEEGTWLHCLGHLADTQPEVFREWLSCARELFPFAVGDTPLSITEEDIHALPEVPDGELRATFLGHPQGRQFLLATFVAVMRQRRAMRDALVGIDPRCV